MEEDKEREPLTYGSVLGLIEEHGGPEGLNLRGMNLMGIEFLPNDDLHGIIFTGANLRRARFLRTNLQGAIFTNAKLEKADLGLANLQKANLTLASLEEAHFENADLQEANLTSANLRKADLSWANLSKARLYNAQISQETRLENVNWGPKYILGEERSKDFRAAVSVYRMLERWYEEAGFRRLASEFAIRKHRARRKAIGGEALRKFKEVFHR